MWDLVPWPGIEPRLPELGVWSISYCTTREVLGYGTLSTVQRIWEKWVRMDLSRVIRSNSSGKRRQQPWQNGLGQFSRSVLSNSLLRLDCSTADFPVHPQLPGVAQTQVHRVSDAIQPSHPLSSHSPPAFNLSQHQGLFKWVSSSHQVAKLLEFQLQHKSFQWTFRTDFL